MWPNPANSKLNLSTGICDKYMIEISDLSGKKIFAQNYFDPEITINTSAFAKGVYLLTVKYRDFSKTQRLIIE
jgi:hypothetical protein